MNDDFLYTNRPPVRKAFADSLYQGLSSGQYDRRGIRHNFAWQVALPAVLLIAVLVVTFSEPVRAMALGFIRTIAGFTVEERSVSPLDDVDLSEVTIYEVPSLTVSALLENPPFTFGMPDWVPEGFLLETDAAVASSGDWLSLLWKNTNNSQKLLEIDLLVEHEYTGYSIPAGEGSSEEITILGQPALLTLGTWDAQNEWDPTRGITIGWMNAELHYRLRYTERLPATLTIAPIEGDVEAIVAVLIRMAESIP